MHSDSGAATNAGASHLCLLPTLLPFPRDSRFVQCCTGWAAAAGVTGAYSEANLKDRSLGKAASTAAKAWALAVPVRHV